MKIVLLFLLLISSAHADEWKSADTKREAIYLTLHTVDWAQTRNIARNPGRCFRVGYTGCYEQNPLLGKTPSVGKVDGYFALTGLAHVAVAYYLPAEYRKAFQYVTIGIEGGAVAHNFSIGIGVKF